MENRNLARSGDAAFSEFVASACLQRHTEELAQKYGGTLAKAAVPEE